MLGKQIIELDNYEKCWIGWLIKPYKVNQIKFLVKRKHIRKEYAYIHVIYNECSFENDVPSENSVSTAYFQIDKYFTNMKLNKYYTPVEAGLYYES